MQNQWAEKSFFLLVFQYRKVLILNMIYVKPIKVKDDYSRFLQSDFRRIVQLYTCY